MKKARRNPRKIGQDDEDDQGGKSDEPSPVVRRLQGESKTFKPKKPSNLRASFASSSLEDDAFERPADDGATNDDPFAVIERKKHARESLLTPAKLPYRRSPDPSTDTPSYSADYLAELKQSQQSTPRNLHNASASSNNDDEDTTTQKPLNIASKFGTSDALLRSSASPSNTQLAPHIPTDAEIREKKERRRRLAREEKEEDFISLNGSKTRRSSSTSSSDSDTGHASRRKRRDGEDTLIIPAEQVTTTEDPGSRIGVSALSDDDLAEGFDDFVEDSGRVALGRQARREQDARRRREIAAQIAGAENGDRESDRGSEEEEDDEDPDERARLNAYEAAQTHHGTYLSRSTNSHHRSTDEAKAREDRWRAITTRRYKIVPLPTLKGEQEKWRRKLEEKRSEREACERRIEGVKRERKEAEGEEVRVHGLLQEAGERLERLMGENGQAEAERVREERRAAREVEDGGETIGSGASAGERRGGLGSGARAGLGMGSGLAVRGGIGGIGAERGLESFAGMAGMPSSSAAGDE